MSSLETLLAPTLEDPRVANLLSSSPTMSARLDATLAELEQKAQELLELESPFEPYLLQLGVAERELVEGVAEVEDVRRDWQHFEAFLDEVHLPKNARFWQSQLEQLAVATDAAVLIRRLLLIEWRKQLDRCSAKWEMERLALIRAEMLEQLKDWIETLIELSRGFERLGLDPGHLVDFSAGRLEHDDIEKLKKWADYLAENPGVLELCERIGKKRKPSYSTHYEKVTVRKRVEMNCHNAPAPEAIIGLSIGRELEHVLPAELAQLGDPDTAALFDLKYLESKLMSFDMRGWQPEWVMTDVEEMKPVTLQDNDGPMVLCVDTSLSMEGVPETVAKAVALFLSSTGRAQQRDCYLINFSTEIETLDLSSGYALTTLLKFLSKSFKGGTDVVPAIHQGLGVLKQDGYRHADMVIVSDFVMVNLPLETLKAMSDLREDGNRFYSLVIGEQDIETKFRTQFDCEWHYQPESANISERERGEDADQQLDRAIELSLITTQGSA